MAEAPVSKPPILTKKERQKLRAKKAEAEKAHARRLIADEVTQRAQVLSQRDGLDEENIAALIAKQDLYDIQTSFEIRKAICSRLKIAVENTNEDEICRLVGILPEFFPRKFSVHPMDTTHLTLTDLMQKFPLNTRIMSAVANALNSIRVFDSPLARTCGAYLRLMEANVQAKNRELLSVLLAVDEDCGVAASSGDDIYKLVLRCADLFEDAAWGEAIFMYLCKTATVGWRLEVCSSTIIQHIVAYIVAHAHDFPHAVEDGSPDLDPNTDSRMRAAKALEIIAVGAKKHAYNVYVLTVPATTTYLWTDACELLNRFFRLGCFQLSVLTCHTLTDLAAVGEEHREYLWQTGVIHSLCEWLRSVAHRPVFSRAAGVRLLCYALSGEAFRQYLPQDQPLVYEIAGAYITDCALENGVLPGSNSKRLLNVLFDDQEATQISMAHS